MKNTSLSLAGVLALAAILGKFYALPALAQATRAALVQDRDNPARSAFTVKVPVDGNLNAAFPTVPAGKRMVLTNMYFNVLANVIDAQCHATVTADNGHESRYNLLSISSFITPTYAGSAPFDMALDTGQRGETGLFCTYQFQNETITVTPFPTAIGPATATEMDVVYSGYFIDVP
jgi:hypothetical protein